MYVDMTVLPFLYISALFTGFIMGVNGPTRKIHQLEGRIDELEGLLRRYKQDIDAVLSKNDESEEETPESETDDEMPPLVSEHLD
jgi:DNA repair ATPase RecN